MTTTLDGADLTRADLLDLLWEFNVDAKAISRRGRAAQSLPEYGDAHAAIDDVLDRLLAEGATRLDDSRAS